MLKKIAYPLFMLLFLVMVLLTCNTMNHEQSQEQRWLFKQEELGKGYRWLYQQQNIGIRALAHLKNDELFFKDFAIMVNDSTIYFNTTDLFTTQFDLLPIVRQLPNKQHEIQMGISPEPEQYRILQLIFTDTSITKTDTLPLFDGQHANADADTTMEFKGYWSNLEPYCFDCDSTYYNPQLYYEMLNTGFTLDTATTKQWIDTNYGTFNGFRPNKNLIVPLKNTNL